MPQGLEAAVAVGGGEVDAEEVAELAVEVGQLALGPAHHADDDVLGPAAQRPCEGLGGLALAESGLAEDGGVAPVPDDGGDAVEEELDAAGEPDVLDGDGGQKTGCT